MGSAAYKYLAKQLGADTIYMMDEVSGHPQDTSGNARHCTASANLTYGATGPFIGSPNRAISSAGSGTATMPATVTLPGDLGGNVACPVTLVWWHKAPSGSATQGVINMTPTGAGTDRFAIQAPHSDDNVYCDHWDNNDTTNGRLTYAYTGKRNAWHMLGFKSSGLSGSPKALIVDTTVVASSINSDAPDAALAGGTLFTTPTGPSTSTMAGLALFKTYLSDANIVALNGAGLAPVAVGYTMSVAAPVIAGAATTVTVEATPAGAFFDGSVAITLTPSGTGGSAVVITPGGNTSGTGSYTPATAGDGTLTGTNNGGWSNPSAATFTVLAEPTGEVELLGTTFGTAAFGGDTATYGYPNAFDGDFATFFTSSVANAYAGRDAGSGVAVIPRAVLIAPRPSLNDGSAAEEGGQYFTVDASNAGQNTTLVTLDTHNPTEPYAPRNQLTTIRLPNAETAYRYLRLTSLGVSGNWAEIIFVVDWAAGVLSRPSRPVFGPSGGRFTEGTAMLRIASGTGTASIYYTLDGTTPTTASTLYTEPVTITPSAGGVTVKAIAYDPALSTPLSVVVTSAPFFSTAVAAGGDEYDDQGILVEAHGGHVMLYAGVYYRYGYSMNRTDVGDNVRGSIVNCYSSTDGRNWRKERHVTNMPAGVEYIERPHQAYNPATGYFVQWSHPIDQENVAAAADVAWCRISRAPTGPWALARKDVDPNGLGYQDGNFFADTDGKAYLVHVPRSRDAIVIAELTPDWQGLTGEYVTLDATGLDREAPVLFKRNGVYFLLTSVGNFYDSITLPFNVRYIVGTGGTTPLDASWSAFPGAVAFATVPTTGTVYNTQPTCVFPAGDGSLIYVGDYWTVHSPNMMASRQVWSKISFPTETTLSIPLAQWTPIPAAAPRVVRIVRPEPPRIVRPVHV